MTTDAGADVEVSVVIPCRNEVGTIGPVVRDAVAAFARDRKSTRLNSSHV